MRHLLVAVLACLASAAQAQTLPSPPASSETIGGLVFDYLGYEPSPGVIIIQHASGTNCVVTAWNVTNAIPTWASLFSATNIAAAKLRRAALSSETNKWTREQRFDFEVHFDMENRMRAQESKAAITKQQYFNALNTVWTNTP